MNRLRCLLVLLLAVMPSFAAADVDPVAVRIPEKKAWTGQMASFFVELRAAGSFDGAASFSIPDVPRTVIIKVGNPVVSSEEIEGDSWFVQTHEFALFSQQSGTLKVPAFEVRFASRKGFTDPATDQKAMVPELTMEIQRPPGTDQLGFLVTTESIDISETWDPQPGPAKIGDLFKRTISQTADQMTGIALAPPPDAAPDGVRVYLANPQVTDNTERGDFTGRRVDTITYVLQEPGTHTLPGITYVWFNPKKEQVGSKTLPAVTIDVAAPPVAAASPASAEPLTNWIAWLAAALVACGTVVWQRERIAAALELAWKKANPPERVAARQLLRACRRNDPAAASRAWMEWLSLQNAAITRSEKLNTAAIGLERHVYGTKSQEAWQGRELEQAFREQRAEMKRHKGRRPTADLPLLNPSS